MNRRQFTASLGAAATLPFLPALPARAAASTGAVIPAGAYAWADLIVRAQNRASPEMLARQLRLAPDAARQLFNTMVSDGVLHAPGASGVARAVAPIRPVATNASLARRAIDQTRRMIPAKNRCDDLVNGDDPCQGYDDISGEDQSDAHPPQSLQESPGEG